MEDWGYSSASIEHQKSPGCPYCGSLDQKELKPISRDQKESSYRVDMPGDTLGRG